MSAELTSDDLSYARDFVESADAMEAPRRRLATFASALLILCGVVLGGYAVYLFTTNPTDQVAKYVLLPGAGGGLGLAVLGLIIPNLCSHCEEKKRLGAIVAQLLPADTNTED